MKILLRFLGFLAATAAAFTALYFIFPAEFTPDFPRAPRLVAFVILTYFPSLLLYGFLRSAGRILRETNSISDTVARFDEKGTTPRSENLQEPPARPISTELILDFCKLLWIAYFLFAVVSLFAFATVITTYGTLPQTLVWVIHVFLLLKTLTLFFHTP